MAEETQKQNTSNSGFKYSYEELNGSRIKLNIEIPALVFQKEEEKAFNELSVGVKVQGFRPGKAPIQMMRAQLGAAPYERALNELLPKATLEIVNELAKSEERNFTPMDNVSYELAKVQPSTGVTFHATFTIYPKVKLGDVSKIKLEKRKVDVNNEDVQKVIDQMFEDWKKQFVSQEKQTEKPSETKSLKDGDKTEKKEEVKKYDKPNDEWVANELQMEVKSLPELETLVKNELLKQKENQEEERSLDDLMNQVINISSVDVPESFIEIELDNQEDQYKKRIENIGLSVEDFLKNQNTTMSELRKTWRPSIIKRIQIDLVLLEISKENKLSVTDEEINQEIALIEDEKTKKIYDTENGRGYIKDIKLRQKSVEKLKSLVKS